MLCTLSSGGGGSSLNRSIICMCKSYYDLLRWVSSIRETQKCKNKNHLHPFPSAIRPLNGRWTPLLILYSLGDKSASSQGTKQHLNWRACVPSQWHTAPIQLSYWFPSQATMAGSKAWQVLTHKRAQNVMRLQKQWKEPVKDVLFLLISQRHQSTYAP